MIYYVAAELYPVVWGGNDGRDSSSALSNFGTAVNAINGNCGYGYKVNYVSPSSGDCNGYFSISNDTCYFECIAAEAVYLGLKSYLGSQMSTFAMDEVADRWTLNYPDTGMADGTTSAGKEMQTVSADFYAMMQPDSDNIESKWQPQIWPNGTYSLTPTVTASASTTVRSGDLTYSTWWASEGEQVMADWELSQQTLLYDDSNAQNARKIVALIFSLSILNVMVYV